MVFNTRWILAYQVAAKLLHTGDGRVGATFYDGFTPTAHAFIRLDLQEHPARFYFVEFKC